MCPGPHLSAFTRLCSPDARLAGRCVRGRTRHGTSGHSPSAELGVPFGKARALPVPEPNGPTAPSSSPSPTARAYSSVPTVRASPSPDTRHPVHPATKLASCNDPHACAAVYRRLPPTPPAAPRALPRPFSGKPYLRVGKPTRHLAFGNSLWHDPIQRRTRFLTHLPSLSGLIGVSSHTRPPESSTGAPAPAV